MTLRRTLLIGLILCACGESALSIHVVFPDEAAQKLARRLVLYAIDPDVSSLTCQTALGQTEAALGTALLQRAELTLPSSSAQVFPNLPMRTMLISALVYNDANTVLMQGCTEVRASPGDTLDVRVVLSCVSGQYCGACGGCVQAGTCFPGTDDAHCGSGGGTCQDCGPTGKPCYNTTCGGCNGCLSGGTCLDGTTSAACGTSGGLCQDCGATNRICAQGVCTCQGCMSSGTCVPGTDNAACGTGGGSCESCSSTGKTCSAGTCVCNGCLSGSTCVAGKSSTQCGTGGAQCQNCASNGRSCSSSSTCVCTGCLTGTTCYTSSASHCGTSGAACDNCSAKNEYCSGGSCQCAGCHSGGDCYDSTVTHCGTGGGSCQVCASSNECQDPVCNGGSCGTTAKTDTTSCSSGAGQCFDGNCCTGCISGSTCWVGNAVDHCGVGGAACQACTLPQTCVAGTCA
jgi:hypothetical protein